MHRKQSLLTGVIFYILLVLATLPAYAQSYANDWLINGQSYYKIPVSNTGFYKVDYNAFISSNIPLGAFTPQNIQLFFRGRQQNIRVTDNNSNNIFDSDDYFEFYGIRNNGNLDSLLYTSKSAQLNPNYNLYSDTTYYFLTASGTGPYKRMPVQNFSGTVVNQSYVYDEKITNYTEKYLEGFFYYDQAYNSQYQEAEGWTSFGISPNSITTKTIPISSSYTGGGQAYLEVALSGYNSSDNTSAVYAEHQFQLYIGKDASSLQLLANSPTFNTNRGFINYTFSVPISDLSSFVNNTVTIGVINNNAYPEALFVFGYIKIKYPQQLTQISDFKNFVTEINAGNTYNFALAAGINPGCYDITDYNNVSIINNNIVGNTLSLNINNTSIPHTIAVNPASIVVRKLLAVNVLPKFNSTDSTYIIVSHPFLMQPAAGFPNAVQAYADYRASAAGGRFDVLSLSILDLYDNFNYGEKSPAALRALCEYMTRDNSKIPDYLFIIGKGLDINYQIYRLLPSSQKTTPDFIPSWGYPSSDHHFSQGLAGRAKYVSAIPTGRIAATTPLHVINYLNKIMDMESQNFEQLWRKQAIHLSGGHGDDQIRAFRAFLDGLATVYKGPYLGGMVKSFSKTTSNNIEIFDLSKEVNAGCSLMTFYGHSAPGVTDIDIGYVSSPLYSYNNVGKYPVILLNGCASGNMYADYSFGEDWINTANKGAIAFVGNSGNGFTNSLSNYSQNWYNTNFADSSFINKSIGNIQTEALRRVIEQNLSPFRGLDSIFYVSQVQQSNLQGDPAFVLFRPSKPDYQTSDEQLFIKSINGQPVTAVSDSFRLGIIIKNYGQTKNQIGINVQITRRFPNGSTLVYSPKIYSPISNIDTVYFTVPTGGNNSFGNNSLTVVLDYTNSIPETNENNNTGTISFFLQQSGVACLFPKEFSIVNKSPVSLIAQSTDLLTKNKDYYFEIDTSWTFNSQIKQSLVVSSTSLPTWNDVNILQSIPANSDSVVFYWRVRYKDLATGVDTLYGTSSFIYIPNSSEGWAQAQFPQFFKDNDSPSIVRDTLQRKWKFRQETLTIDLDTYGGGSNYNYRDVKLVINGINYIVNGNFEFYGSDGMLAVAIHKDNLATYTEFGDIFYTSVPLFTGGTNSAVNRFVANGFVGDTTQPLNAFTKFSAYLDSIKTQDYVLLFSVGNADYENWSSTTKNKLINQGATQFQNLVRNDPYILLYQKDVGVIAEVFPNKSDPNYLSNPLSLTQTLSLKYNTGTITSTKIGPASSWKQLFRNIKIDNPAGDIWTFDLMGYDKQNKEVVLIPSFVPANGMDISTTIDSTIYNYIALRANLQDNDANTLTPPQIKHWIVTYNNNIPEGTLIIDNSNDQYTGTKSVLEGDKVNITYSFKNISNKPFKNPLIIQYSIKNLNTNQVSVSYDTIKYVLEPQALFTKTYTFDTYNFAGDNNLQVYVNPQLQPEEYYTNNVFILPVKVISSNTNPVLEVTFDGAKIFDGDIVSPTPLINITVSDYNKFKFKTDTTGIKLLLTKDSLGAAPQLLTFNTSGVKFYPETANNKFRVEYQPPMALRDGRYILSAQAQDASNNVSGINPYQVRFEVVNKSEITNFFPYPNPFSNHTRFVFTLTGAEIPSEIKIQIMTITGVVVREILQNEIGPIRIGNNITQYAWDGTDEYGAKLANGVYLYRVYVRSNGKTMDHRGTAADKAFKHDIGKLVILR